MKKRERMRNRIGLLTLVVLVSFQTKAQEIIPSDTFRVVKEYKPTIDVSKKIMFVPEIDDKPMKLETKLEYNFLNKQIPVSFQIEPIGPAKIKGEPLVKLYNGYAKLGVGNAIIPFAEVYYNNARSKDYAWGTHVKYLKLKELKDYKESDQSKAHISLYGKRFWKKNTVDASFNYDLHDLNYYGLHQISSEVAPVVAPDYSIAQTYNRIGFSTGIASTKKDSFNLRYNGDIKYNLISAKGGTVEHNILGNVNLSQFQNSELYNLDFMWDYNQYDFSSNSSILALTPQISTIGENFRINVGLGVYMNAANDADFHFYPIAEVKFNVIEDFLVPYVGINGKIRRNSYNMISVENPFIGELLNLQNTNEKLNFYGGFRGTLSKETSFNLSGSLTKIENEYLYVKAFPFGRSLEDRFSLIYDNIDELEIKGELAFRKDKKITIYLLGQYFNYSTENEIKAWHKPELKITLSGEYNIQKKIIIRADVFYWGEQFAKTYDMTKSIYQTQPDPLGLSIFIPGIKEERLEGIIDANLGFEYRYTKKLSAFVDFNNIGGINYEKYQDYPTQGFNVLGGLTYAF